MLNSINCTQHWVGTYPEVTIVISHHLQNAVNALNATQLLLGYILVVKQCNNEGTERTPADVTIEAQITAYIMRTLFSSSG